MEVLSGIFSAFGLSASAGLNAYIPLLIISLTGRYFPSLMNLNSPWDTLTNGWIIGLLVVLSTIEFFADKIPVVDHINDGIQTFVRPTAGAVAFAATTQVITDINPVVALAIGLLVAGGVHAAKAGALRPAVTATTGGLGNPVVSFLEDIVSVVVSILSILIPIFVGILLIMVASWVIWLMWRRSNRLQAQQTSNQAK